MNSLNAKIPDGPLAEKWTNHKNGIHLISPVNKRTLDVIVVGTGLAGGSAAATLAELGYNVKAFCFQDSPRRAHSVAAQGGINAAKNYQGDGDLGISPFLRHHQRGRLPVHGKPMYIVWPKCPPIS